MLNWILTYSSENVRGWIYTGSALRPKYMHIPDDTSIPHRKLEQFYDGRKF